MSPTTWARAPNWTKQTRSCCRWGIGHALSCCLHQQTALMPLTYVRACRQTGTAWLHAYVCDSVRAIRLSTAPQAFNHVT